MEHHSKKPTVKGPAEWFTGDVWIDTAAQGHSGSPLSVAFVRFSPGARTAWHSHSVAQTLYVIEGEGRAQARGEPVVALRAGEVVFAPAREWHWHGAAPGHFMTHLAVSEGDPTWGNHVTDTEYEPGPQ
ncbi:MAG TPA: cupin domain-containing protein [Acidimicrobiales bacterium]|nr:cupin domain-containing protein [Acidimicrobiales bacterium]